MDKLRSGRFPVGTLLNAYYLSEVRKAIGGTSTDNIDDTTFGCVMYV